MSLIIHVSSNPFPHKHLHFCPYCKKAKMEPNDVCKKQFDHEYHCMDHIQHFREAWGMLDALIDVTMTIQEVQLFKEVWQEDPEKNPMNFTG